ncbi:MAG: hypothetical protein R2735_14575 [Microthrixaceae bacterium]
MSDLRSPSGFIIKVMDVLERRLYQRAKYVTTDAARQVLGGEYGLALEKVLMLENGATPTPSSRCRWTRPLLADFGVEGKARPLRRDTWLCARARWLPSRLLPARRTGAEASSLRRAGIRQVTDRGTCGEQWCRDKHLFRGQQPPDVIAGLYAGAVAGLSRRSEMSRSCTTPARQSCLSAWSCARPLVYSGAGEGAASPLSVRWGSHHATHGDGDAPWMAVRGLLGDPLAANAMGERGT